MLVEGSGIDPEVVAERGVRTITRGRELPNVFSWRQKRRAPGILFTAHRPNGQTSWVFRPDRPDPKNPGYKYAQPPKAYGGQGNVLDAHPSLHRLIDDASAPVVFTEGIKKADAITSAARADGTDLLTVAISGVWNWMSGGEPIADMYEIPVEGRTAYVCFDSDMLSNPNVQQAAERLAEHLEGRGAEVWIVYLPDQPDGSKVGADDFVAGGGTLGELLALARPFDPEDMHRQKLSRSERLRRSYDYLARQEKEMPTKTRRECSKLATWRASLKFAKKSGKLVEDGIEAVIPSMQGAEIAGMSQPTFSACMLDLIEDGRVRRIEPEQSDHAFSYVLIVPKRAVLYNHGGGRGTTEERGSSEGSDHGSHRGYKETRAPVPELRWPYVATVREKDRRGRLVEVFEYVARLGKRRGEVVRFLLERGGSSTVPELMERFAGEKTRRRDFVRRQLSDLLGHRRQHKGTPLSVGPPIMEIEGDVVRLLADWRGALEVHMELGGEQDAAIRQKAAHLRQRAAYRARNEAPPDPAPTEEEMAEGREARQKRRRAERLAHEGMAARAAAREVLGADGFVGDLSPEADPDPPPDPSDGHSLACGCLGCSVVAPSYARVVGR